MHNTNTNHRFLGVSRRWRIGLFVLFICGLPILSLQAQQVVADTLSIRFRLDSIRIDMGYEDNALHWNTFEENFRKNYAHLNAANLRLDIYAGASPEGTAAHNRWLGENRGLATRRLVRQRLGDKVGTIIVHNEGARWEGLYDLVAASHEPWRDEVLRIIDQPAGINENLRDPRETLLRNLHGGTVWPILVERYLAPLRSGATAILSWQNGGRDTIVVRDTVFIVNQPYYVIGDGTNVKGQFTAADAKAQRAAKEARRDSIRQERMKFPAWAVKTNLLLWGVVAPNIEVEIPLGHKNRWSMEIEYFAPWFTWSHNAHASQFQNLGIEFRHWLGHRLNHPWLQGWHIGLAVAGGYYDIEWKKHEGYQGEYINGYWNIGYQHRWGMHWGLDFGLGVGVMVTNYRHYYGGSVFPQNHLEPYDKHLIWHDTDHRIWYGPCHANVSLVYLFNAWPFHFKSKKL